MCFFGVFSHLHFGTKENWSDFIPEDLRNSTMPPVTRLREREGRAGLPREIDGLGRELPTQQIRAGT